MKFDKFPYSKRPKLEVFIMDWFAPSSLVLMVIAFLYIFTACDKVIPQETAADKQSHIEEDKRYEKGPKYRPGCFKITNKKLYAYGCTFQATQGEYFINFIQNPPKYSSSWHVVWNRSIHCLEGDRMTFVKEEDVKNIKCPKKLYGD